MSAVIPLARAETLAGGQLLPYADGSLSVLKARHDWLWLSQISPAGVRTKVRWIDLRAAAAWFRERGRDTVSQRLSALADHVEGGGGR